MSKETVCSGIQALDRERICTFKPARPGLSALPLPPPRLVVFPFA